MPINLDDILPPVLRRRVKQLTQSDHVEGSLLPLCEAGYVELASQVLYYLVGAGGDTSFNPFPLNDRVLSCEVFSLTESLIIVFRLEREGQEDFVCVAIDNPDNEEVYIVRPCTRTEIEANTRRDRVGENRVLDGLL